MSARYGGPRRGSTSSRPAQAGQELPSYAKPARSTWLARITLLVLALVDVAGLLYLGLGDGAVVYLSGALQ